MNELIVKNNPGLPTEHEMMVFQTMCKSAVESKMYKGVGDQAGVMMIMLSARELGIPPCQALNGGINIINGKVEISARMMSALIRKAGHWITIKESTNTHCILIGKRCDTVEIQSASFSLAEAQMAGLVKPGGGWVKWPKDMCFARALSRLARQLFSDVIGIGYVEGEINHSAEIKSSEIEAVIQEQLTFIEDVPVEDEREFLDKFLILFDRDEKHFAMQYLKVVQNHFDWTPIQTIKELLKDQDRLLDKFNTWKAKTIKNESENE